MKAAVRVAMAGMFLVTGALHFLKTDEFVRIVPPGLPWPRALVYISGVCELLGGVGLLIPSLQRVAAYGLAVFLIAVFPANLYMATAGIKFGGIFDHPLYHVIRLPLQFVLIALLLWSTK